MTRTVPYIKPGVVAQRSSEDPFNVLNFEVPKECPGVTADNHHDDDSTGEELRGFYRDSVLLVTGGTGFLGRILLQKLLRTFPIKRIYLLVRKKNTQSVEERMDEFFQNLVRICVPLKWRAVSKLLSAKRPFPNPHSGI